MDRERLAGVEWALLKAEFLVIALSELRDREIGRW